MYTLLAQGGSSLTGKCACTTTCNVTWTCNISAHSTHIHTTWWRACDTPSPVSCQRWLGCPSLWCDCCSYTDSLILTRDEEQNAVLLRFEMIPDTTYGLVIFSRPLVTSDDNDQNLDQPLYLRFGFGEFIVNSSFPIGDPGDNRWISRRPIQFDCSLNCKHVCVCACVFACVCGLYKEYKWLIHIYGGLNIHKCSETMTRSMYVDTLR